MSLRSRIERLERMHARRVAAHLASLELRLAQLQARAAGGDRDALLTLERVQLILDRARERMERDERAKRREQGDDA